MLFRRFVRNPVRSVIATGIILGILVAIVFALFFIGRESGWFWNGYVIDNELWGNVGDFIGGLFGPFLSMLSLLVVAWTFVKQQNLERRTSRLQTDLSRQANEQAEIQRFNDLFFSLLSLYQSTLSDIVGYVPNAAVAGNTVMAGDIAADVGGYSGGRKISGKEFFSYYMTRFLKEFEYNGYYSRSRNAALNMFSEVYDSSALALSVYFRTVYRIFGLIDGSDLKEDEKIKYAKIMRAQLTRGELFFLHYNARTMTGEPTVGLINKYRVTKHLHALDYLEFYRIRACFARNSEAKTERMNIILYHVWKKIYMIMTGRQILDQNHSFVFDFSKKYVLTICYPDHNHMSLRLTIYKKRRNLNSYLTGLRDLTKEDKKWLLKHFLILVFCDSSFQRYNPESSVDVSVSVIADDADRYIVESAISAREGHSLRIRHPDFDRR